MKLAVKISLVVLVLSMVAPIAFAAGGGGGEHAVPHSPDVNWTEGLLDLGGTPGKNPPFVAVLINFAIFIGLLVWKAGPPLTSYLNKRHTDVKGALEEAARMHAEASELLAERQTKLGAVGREVDELIEGMRTDGESEKQRMVEEAETAAKAAKRDADDRIAASVTRARQAIEAEVVAASIAAAEALIREKGTDDDHNSLVESFITSLTDGTFDGGGSSPPSRPKSDSSVDEGWS